MILEILNEKWGIWCWYLFTAIALSFFIDGFLFTIAPILSQFIAPAWAIYILALNLASFTVGSILFGALSDKIGRRKTFLTVVISEVILTVLLYFLYSNPILFTILTSLICLVIGGEFGAAFAAVAELVPSRHRGKTMLLAINFWNLGPVILAALSILYEKLFTTPTTYVKSLLLSILLAVIIVGLIRVKFPESIRWLITRGRLEEAKKIAEKYLGTSISDEDIRKLQEAEESKLTFSEVVREYSDRFIILLIITIVVYVTYFIPAFYLPYVPDFPFPKLIPYIILTANAGSFIGAFLLIPFIDKSRRISTTVSLVGGFVTTIPMIYSVLARIPGLFLTSLFLNMVFSQWAWACLSTLQTELFPTGIRSTVVGLLVSLEGVVGSLLTLAELSLTTWVCLAIMATLWLTGTIAAVVWHIKGVETAGLALEDIVHSHARTRAK